jgi:hypothetical protein
MPIVTDFCRALHAGTFSSYRGGGRRARLHGAGNSPGTAPRAPPSNRAKRLSGTRLDMVRQPTGHTRRYVSASGHALDAELIAQL